MSQRILLFFCLLNFGVSVYLFVSRSTSEELVYIDSAKLLNGYQGMIDARGVFQKKAATWKANIDSLSANVTKSIMAYENELASMTTKERALTRELIESKQMQLSQYRQALDAKARDEDNKMTADVIAQVNAYLKRYGAEHNYQIIFAATESGNIAYAHDSRDVTDKILEGLNGEYNGKLNK